MNTEILNTEIQDFINANLNSNLSKILLKGTNFNNLSTLEIIEQIEAKLKCKTKLPTWFNTANIYFPNKLNIEQTSSEYTAAYKTQLLSGLSLIDITGGFGVDAYYFSKVFKLVVHCEIDKNLSSIVKHNNKLLNLETIETIPSDGIAFLISEENKYDWIYIDPSRRHDSKGKVFFLKDCVPNVPLHLSTLFNHSNNIAIKTSPLLDLSIGIEELKFVKEIHIIAVKNEAKELLWILEKGFKSDIAVKTVNLINDKKDIFSFVLKDESNARVTYEKPLKYLYEPNAAIMKSGGFKSLAIAYQLSKLHQHSHLYTSNTHIDFPGRTFKIEAVVDYNKKNIKALDITQANITTRNHPETVEQLRKKYRIKDGGNTYLFFTTNVCDERIVIVCSKSN